jgi:ribosomal protein S18 acetylase RimI-like enzyme
MPFRDGRVVVRLERPSDYVQLARVYTDAFAPTTAGDLRRVRRQRPREQTLVAVVDGVVASAVSIEIGELLVDGIPVRTGCIASVATDWDHRRQGLATLLLREAHRRLRARGVSNASLFTLYNLPAIRIYKRFGYTETSAWRRFLKLYRPIPWLEARFAYRSNWLKRTPFGREALARWRERVLLRTPEWSATISFDGKRFRVQSGRRGRPTLVVRGAARLLLNCFGNRLAYDAAIRREAVRVTGPPEASRLWRRIQTLEWRE